MPYSPPDFRTLIFISKNLENHFSALANRYTSSSLVDLLAAVATEIVSSKNYKSKSLYRREQADVFRTLSNELFRIPDDAGQQNEALQCMLGALIHRMIRIETEYTTRIDSMFLSVIGQSNPKNCGLYQAIHRVLGICPENPLDPLTIVTCCQSFYDNMLKDHRYQKFPHFKKDPQFFNNLQEIIDKYRLAAKPALLQTHAIKFLQSMAVQMEAVTDKTAAECQKLIDHLRRYYPDISKLDLDTIIKILPDKIKDEGSRQRVQLLLGLSYVVKSFPSWDYNEFQKRLLQCLEARSQYALFGAYSLVFEDKPDEMRELKDVINLDINPERETIPIEVKLNGIRALEDWFLEIKDNYELDFTTWAGKYEVFEKKVTVYKSNLLKAMAELQQSEQSAADSLRL